jgi:GTPase
MKLVIVGRANVGKSTLFNKIVGRKQALISDISGTTRDTNIGKGEWNGVLFSIYDTAGIGLKPENEIEEKVKTQSENKIKQADLIIFLLDGQEEILPQDKKIAKILRASKKTVIMAVNKIDSPKLRRKVDIFEFEKLGFKNPQIISSSSGSGVGDLLDEVVDYFKKNKKKSKKTTEENVNQDLPEINVTLSGKPNAGKSSIMNALITRKVHIKDQEKIIVTNIPHTTREPQEREIITTKYKIKFVDTAGIRRKSKIEKKGLERLSVRKSIGELKRADITLFVLDLSEPLTSQNKKISGLTEDVYSGLIIIGNKWDAIKDKTMESDNEFKDYLKRSLPFLKWAPVVFTSATEGKNILKIPTLIEEIFEERNKKLDDEEMEKFIGEIIKRKRPIRAKGTRNPKVHGFTQTGTNPPKFTIVIGPRDTIHFSYLRYIENRLREKYGFGGTPIQIRVKKLK